VIGDMNKTIKDIHLQKTGKVSDKWSSYLDYYDSVFYNLKNEQINLLEIGVQNGGSLETWAEYFTNAKNIIGCDIDEKCKELLFEDNRINLVVSDIKTEYAYQEITKHCNNFDIIIDDGSHFSIDILTSFVTFFPLLKPGGVYIVEDTHTLYWHSWGSERTNRYNAYIFFKKIIDAINYQFWSTEENIDSLYHDFFVRDHVPSFISSGWIDSIEFRNSIITIKKAKQALKDGLGSRLVTGSEALVHSNVLEHQRQ